MDSINRNQPEENQEDLRAAAAIDKIKEIAGKAQNCFFCTSTATGPSQGARPMNVRRVDDRGTLWFLSASDSHKNAELARDPSVTLYFHGATHSDFLCVRGRASISTDRATIEELWSPPLRTWFTGGADDPRITVIEVAPTDGYYWDTKHGAAVAGVKILAGAMLGKTLDDSIEGTLSMTTVRRG
jgi:general stress protein 26